jgi:hypothetical protein
MDVQTCAYTSPNVYNSDYGKINITSVIMCFLIIYSTALSIVLSIKQLIQIIKEEELINEEEDEFIKEEEVINEVIKEEEVIKEVEVIKEDEEIVKRATIALEKWKKAYIKNQQQAAVKAKRIAEENTLWRKKVAARSDAHACAVAAAIEREEREAAQQTRWKEEDVAREEKITVILDIDVLARRLARVWAVYLELMNIAYMARVRGTVGHANATEAALCAWKALQNNQYDEEEDDEEEDDEEEEEEEKED